MLKRPPLGKLSLASKRGRARQLLDREQRERDRRDLLSSVGKNSSLAASSCSGQDTPSRNERYAARVASIEKARLNADADILRAHGITDVAEKNVFDGEGGKPKSPTSELRIRYSKPIPKLRSHGRVLQHEIIIYIHIPPLALFGFQDLQFRIRRIFASVNTSWRSGFFNTWR